ncbi:MAG: response regulator transcription factor [Anaerolineales bacterium]|nr:response regulator transcription factor [Anaerolineales bacterium]
MNEPTHAIRVLVVDDHALVRHGIIGFLDRQPDMKVIGEADSGRAAVRLAAELVPDVMLIDLAMPEMDGIEATAQVRSVSPRTQVIVLTSHHGDEHIFPAIRAGALSYILKDIHPEALLETVRAAARGEAILNPQVAARLVQEMRGGSSVSNPFIELTEREREVLLLVADGLSNTEIAEKLVLGLQTVKGYISNILGKLHLSDRTQAAVFAWREGLKRRDS